MAIYIHSLPLFALLRGPNNDLHGWHQVGSLSLCLIWGLANGSHQ